jgi:alpha-ketoglutarate-dependent taurine dioxygenase
MEYMNLTKITEQFGVSLGFNELNSHSDINELVKTHKLIILNNVDFVNDKKLITDYVANIGTSLDTSEIYKNMDHWFTYTDSPGLDEHVSFGSKPGLESHQDGYWYTQSKNFTCATVYLNDFPADQKSADTVFFSSQCEYNTFSTELKEKLQPLIVSHMHKRDRLEWRKDILSKLRQKYSATPDRYARLLAMLKKRDYKWKPRGFDLNQLVQTDEMGTWLHYSPSGNPEFLTNAIQNTQYQYTHVWKPNQLLFWENKTLVHSRVDNPTINIARKMWRIQYKPL